MKSERKFLIRFIAVMIVLYAAGFLVGKFIAVGENNGSLEWVVTSIKKGLGVMTPVFFLLLGIASIIAVLYLYIKCKKMYKTLQENSYDDDLWDSLEEKLNHPLILANVMQIVNIFFIGCIICIAEFTSYGNNGGFEAAVLGIDTVLFIVIMIMSIVVSRGIVEIEKKLNPEKQGSVFDFRFNDVWMDSCDEGQKLISFKAGYHAFRRTNMACLCLAVLAFLGMLVFKTGIYPLLFVCVLWLIHILDFMLIAAKLEKKRG